MSHLLNEHVRALRLASGALAVAGAASIGPAHADNPGQDWKGYAGINCMGENITDPIRRSAATQIALANTGTSTVKVFCPVVRDVSEAGEDRVTLVRVRLRNRNQTEPGSCEFSSRDLNGHQVEAKSAVAPPNSGEIVLQLGPLNALAWGSYVLSCKLPGRDPQNGQSYIINYRVDERLAP